jgi:DNA-binding XRE family transcriptional regulator
MKPFLINLIDKVLFFLKWPDISGVSTEKNLAIHMKSLRKEKGLTQNALAELADIEYKHIQALESLKNTHSPTLRTLEKISKAFNLEVSEFLKPIYIKKE